MTGTLSALLLNKWDLKTTLFLAECFPFTYKTTKRKSRNAAKYNPTGLYLGELPQKARESGGRKSARETRTAYKRKDSERLQTHRRGTGRKPLLVPDTNNAKEAL